MHHISQPYVRAERRDVRLIFTVLVVAFALSGVVATGLGPVGLSAGEVYAVLAAHVMPGVHEVDPVADAIIWNDRFPRVMTGLTVGGGLAAVGVALQAMVRNRLADPYILGVSAGAGAGAAAAITLGLAATLGGLLLPVFAFGGAVVTIVLVLALAGRRGRSSPTRLILTGVVVGYAMNSLTHLLIFLSDSPESGRSVMFWLLGSLAGASWHSVGLGLTASLLAVAILVAAAGVLDAVASGDETALTVGVDPDRARYALLGVVSVAVGVLVAISGGIGFVGLVVPHLARGLVGARHRVLVPTATLLGGILLTWSDVLARTAFTPQEVPIGVITGLIGAPFLLALLNRVSTS